MQCLWKHEIIVQATFELSEVFFLAYVQELSQCLSKCQYKFRWSSELSESMLNILHRT
uniref:Uncharacterized protein n=1 Tax=Anguilla anguilla TaxID=7936 RepID=A0A0E9VC09_ANGAN